MHKLNSCRRWKCRRFSKRMKMWCLVANQIIQQFIWTSPTFGRRCTYRRFWMEFSGNRASKIFQMPDKLFNEVNWCADRNTNTVCWENWKTDRLFIYSMDLNYTTQYEDMFPQFKQMLEANLRILLYNGDTDTVCNFLSAQWFAAKVSEMFGKKVNKK